MIKKIYISGPMTGKEKLNADEFNKIADKLRDAGVFAINPVDINPPSAPWHICLKEDIKHLLEADGVVLLNGWQKSRGALVEIFVSLTLGIPLFDAYTELPVKISEQEINRHLSAIPTP